MSRKRFAILDRDGTILVKHHYLSHSHQVELLPGTAAGLRHLAAMGWGLVVVTNQSGIGRGMFDFSRLAQIHHRMTDLLHEQGVELDGIYFCPHRPEDGCGCRKPAPRLALRAAADLDFALTDSIVIGDNTCDMNLGRAVRAATLLVRTGHGAEVEASGQVRPDHVADDLTHAARIIELFLASPIVRPQAIAPAA